MVAVSIEAVARVTSVDLRADAFRRLLDADLLRYYAIAAAMLGDRSEAEDAVHDATISAWRRFGDLRDEAKFAAWYDKILVNACRDRLRSRRRHPVADIAAVTDRPATGGDHARNIAAADAVERAMRLLDADHVAVIVLRYEADLTVPAIAARLGIAEGTVKSRLHHGLRRMRDAIEPREADR